MLITQSNIKKNNLSMLLNQLPVLESAYWNAETVPIVESFSGNLLDLETLDEYATYNGMDVIDAFITICESSNINPRRVNPIIDEWRVIGNDYLLNEVSYLIDNDVQVLLKPLSTYDPIRQELDRLMSYCEAGDIEPLNAFLHRDFEYLFLLETESLEQFINRMIDQDQASDRSEAMKMAREKELADVKALNPLSFGGKTLSDEERKQYEEDYHEKKYGSMQDEVYKSDTVKEQEAKKKEEEDAKKPENMLNSAIKELMQKNDWDEETAKKMAREYEISDIKNGKPPRYGGSTLTPEERKHYETFKPNTQQPTQNTEQSNKEEKPDPNKVKKNIQKIQDNAQNASQGWFQKTISWLHEQMKKYQEKQATTDSSKKGWYSGILNTIAGAIRWLTEKMKTAPTQSQAQSNTAS